jgi:hypothetical protein
MAAKGIQGSALLIGSAGLYLVYAGVKDVPLIDGLRDLLRGKLPSPKAEHRPYAPKSPAQSEGVTTTGSAFPEGDYGLVGNALRGYHAIKPLLPAGTVLHGKAARPKNPDSDHPNGLALDIMTRDNALAQRIIAKFKTTPGAKYWIWNGRLGSITRLWLSYAYTKFGGHYDHVHLSWR